MFGMMLSVKEIRELEYLLKKELEELLLDLGDTRIDGTVKRTMEERYKIIFRLYKRFAPPQELFKYSRRTQYHG